MVDVADTKSIMCDALAWYITLKVLTCHPLSPSTPFLPQRARYTTNTPPPSPLPQSDACFDPLHAYVDYRHGG